MPSLDDTKRLLAMQESAGGSNPRAYQLNNQGAFGKYQITDKTFAGMKANGDIPSDWQHTNPTQADAAGEKLIEQLHMRYGGDLNKVAAAFYAGPKAVQGDKIVNYRDLKNPNNPDVMQYVQQVNKLAGLQFDGDITDTELVNSMPEPGQLSGKVLHTTPMPAPYERTDFGPGGKQKTFIPTGEPAAPLPDATIAGTIGASNAEQFARKRQIEDTPFLDVAKASFNYTLGGTLMRKMVDASIEPEFPVDPKYRPSPEVMAGRTPEEQQELLMANNQEEEQRIAIKQGWRREDEDVMTRGGLGTQLAAGFVAGAPEAIVLGLGTARAMYALGAGSMQLAQAGKTAASLVSLGAENVAAGLVATGATDLLDGHVSLQDYGIGAMMDLATGFLAAPLHVRMGRAAREAHTMFSNETRMGVQAVEQSLVAAKERLGEAAPVEAVQKEAQRTEASAVVAVQQDAQRISADRQLVSEADNRAVFYGEVKEDTQAPAQFGTGPKANMDDHVAWADTALQRDKFSIDGNVKSENVRSAAEAVAAVANRYLPDNIKVRVGELASSAPWHGLAQTDDMTARIALKDLGSKERTIETGFHEVTHVVTDHYWPNAPEALKAKAYEAYDKFLAASYAGEADARNMRFADPGRADMGGVHKGDVIDPGDKYLNDFGEWFAEQGVRVLREDAAGANTTGFKQGLVDTFKKWAKTISRIFSKAKDEGYLKPDASAVEFFRAVREGEITSAGTPERTVKYSQDANAGRNAIMNDPIARKYGVDLLPMATPSERAKAKAITAIYRKADTYARPDEKRLNSILKNTVFADATGTMLRSENPVLRMVASELLESASGATKRQATAAIGKFITERKMLGNSLNIMEGHYKTWRNEVGGSRSKDLLSGKEWAEFNKQVAVHIESKGSVQSHPMVEAAAKELEAAYDRIRLSQVEAKTLGYQGLPATSAGYMPHKMSPKALRNLSIEQQRVLHSALTDQFISIEGFDPTFADHLASKYIDVVRRRGVGGYHGSIGDGAADLSVMEQAIDDMALSKPESDSMKQRMRSGAAGFTKGRLKLDLLKEHALEDGSTFKLLDVFETDQRALLRQQAGRASGEVALARHGILGKPGMQLMREAAELGDVGAKAQPKELEALDQVAAEFLNEPFGTHANKALDRVMQANALARLGSMFFPQAGEFINGCAHLGMTRALSAVPELRRLRAEAKALARGEKIDNPILSSIETVSGAEFGTETYKFSFPFDEPDRMYQAFGQDSLTLVDRLLRGGLHVQAKLSFWRALHAAQQRGMAEQIVRKAARYMREGTEDVALNGMGFTKELRDKFDINEVATWGANGELASLDLTKAKDLTAVEDFIDAVHRGTNQIIQGTFIGEQGKWAHDGLLRFMTQFRSFSITSVEKQWTRQMNDFGPYKGAGILLGSMIAATPIYVARTFLNSVGRKDQEEYLDKMLAPAMMARASLNYIAMSGLAGDFADAFTAVSGTGELTGARTGVSTGFVGTVVAPGAGWVDDVWKGLQNTQDGTDPTQLIKTLPFANLPLLALPMRMLSD